MPRYSLGQGDTGASIINKTTSGPGIAFGLKPRPTLNKILWEFVPGVTPPTSMSLALMVSADGINFVKFSTIVDPVGRQIEFVDVGSAKAVRVDIESISGGSAINSNITA